ncbi:30S ribosomal protein S3 [Patescibacteria group bacterium]|nr:30S ribosomal protein S3 [Patescibacteria group bacterium]MBU1472299.1 30S ribosomal protein S3 [Patescibacteria group bacterium]MBU2460450.1 30S ribosomal protein S3 [Patescibacteria group bacterium]MBU2543985.1 30S ribosomal protein S3 [Patescibacteria group bacterium]
MGQKIHPHGFRLGPVFTWGSRWFAHGRRYGELLLEDVRLRRELFIRLKTAGLAQVEIERSINKVKIILHVSRPGVVIGRGGSGLEEVKKFIEKFIQAQPPKGSGSQISSNMPPLNKTKVELSVEPVKDPNLNAYLVAVNITDQLARRIHHKRVCNQTLDRVMASGAKGIRIMLAGRIAGAEISRKEKYKAGSVPLSTIRERIDYAEVPALTKSGYIGVKVWICRKQ